MTEPTFAHQTRGECRKIAIEFNLKWVNEDSCNNHAHYRYYNVYVHGRVMWAEIA